MAFTAASSNTTALRYVAETVFGQVPPSPVLQDLRYTGESLNFNITNTTSSEIRSDRSTSDLVQTSADTSGDIQVELSAVSYDDFIASAIGDELVWSDTVVTTSTIAAAGSTNIYTIAGGTLPAGVAIGAQVKLTGFATPANNGYKHVTAVSGLTFTVAETLVTEGANAGAVLTASTNVTTAQTPTSVQVTSASQYTLVGTVPPGIVAGTWIYVGNPAGVKFTNSANNGYKQVTAIAGQVITVAQTLAVESAVSSLPIKVGQIVRNNAVYSSFTVQKDLNIDGTTHSYFNYLGMRVGGLSLSFATGSILTGSFSFMGLAQNVGTGALSGSMSSIVQTPAVGTPTTTAATSTNVLNAVGNITNIFFDNVASTSSFAGLTLDIKGNLRAQDAIGSLGHVGIALGRISVTGSAKIYFDSAVLYSKFLAATEFSYSFAVEDSNGKAFIFTLPRVKFSSGTVVSSGLDSDVVFDSAFEAIKSAGASGYTIQVCRF